MSGYSYTKTSSSTDVSVLEMSTVYSCLNTVTFVLVEDLT